MFRFDHKDTRTANRGNEGPETHGLEKKAVYQKVALQYFLPPILSRGVNREYLLKVLKGEVFRVTHSDIKHFEVDLTDDMTKKFTTVNNGLLVRKLNRLLESRRESPLGMDEHDPPDQVSCSHQAWLYRVARYIDPTNLTEFFVAPVYDEPMLNDNSTNISRVYFGRFQASRYFFRLQEAKRHKDLWVCLHKIADQYRQNQGHKLMVETLTQALQEAKVKEKDQDAALKTLVQSTALLYTSLELPNLSTNQILHGGGDAERRGRDCMTMNEKL